MKARAGDRPGFALLAVLWVLVGVAALGLLLQMTAREAQGTAANRIGMQRARWEAQGCLARANAAVVQASDAAPIADSVWQQIDVVIARARETVGCTIDVAPLGITLDVNGATAAQLRQLATAAGVREPAADSLAAAILDWLDADDEPRADGAERGWYVRAGRMPPPNGPVGSVSALRGVRGLEQLPGVDSLLGTEPGRILLTRAPLPVLASLPGFGAEVLARVAERRSARAPLNLMMLSAMVGVDARRALLGGQPAFSSLVTDIPDAWLITARAGDGVTTPRVSVELKVVRSGNRLAVLRRRSW